MNLADLVPIITAATGGGVLVAVVNAVRDNKTRRMLDDTQMRVELWDEVKRLREAVHTVQQETAREREKFDRLRVEYADLRASYERLTVQYSSLQREHDELVSRARKTEWEADELRIELRQMRDVQFRTYVEEIKSIRQSLPPPPPLPAKKK